MGSNGCWVKDIKSSEKKLILTIIQKNKSKVEIYILVTNDCFDIVTAKEIISNINNNIGSTGGGRNDLAQAGLEYNESVKELVAKIKKDIFGIILNKGK